MSAPARSAKAARLRKERQKRMLAFCLTAVMCCAMAVWFALVWSGSARADRQLAAASEKRQQLSETIERRTLLLENEISSRVICQVAEEKLYMQLPDTVKTVNVYLPPRSGSQTAGR